MCAVSIDEFQISDQKDKKSGWQALFCLLNRHAPSQNMMRFSIQVTMQMHCQSESTALWMSCSLWHPCSQEIRLPMPDFVLP
jgi:hypothetical protein